MADRLYFAIVQLEDAGAEKQYVRYVACSALSEILSFVKFKNKNNVGKKRPNPQLWQVIISDKACSAQSLDRRLRKLTSKKGDYHITKHKAQEKKLNFMHNIW